MKLSRYNTRGFCRGKSLLAGLFVVCQILPHQLLHQLIPVQLADAAAGVVVVGDIGGVFGKQVSDDLIDGVVSFLVQSIEHTPECTAHIFFVIAGDCEFYGFFRHGFDLLG